MNKKTPSQAYKDFMDAADREVDNDAETLSLFRDVDIFTTAPREETEDCKLFLRFASRTGDREFVRMIGDRLYFWAKNNGYGAMPKVAALTGALSVVAAVG